MRSKGFIGKIDIWLLLIYLALVTIGILSIYAAAFNESHPHIYDMSQNYGKQMLFFGVSLVADSSSCSSMPSFSMLLLMFSTLFRYFR